MRSGADRTSPGDGDQSELLDEGLHPPFSVEQFFAVFRHYNGAVWPAQFLLFAIGIAPPRLRIARTGNEASIVR